MPIAKFQAPDGRIARFEVPEGMSEQEVTDFAQSHFGGGEQAPAPASAPAAPAGPAPMFGGGKFGGLVQGAKDVGLGAAQLAANLAPKDIQEKLNKYVTEDEAAYQAARQAEGRGEGIDWARIGGGALATAPLGALAPLRLAGTGGQMLAKANAAKNLGKASAQGLIGSQLEPLRTEEEQQNQAGTRGERAALGAGLGAASVPAGAALGRIISPNASQNPEVQRLIREGVTPTPGQILGSGGGVGKAIGKYEEKMADLPILGDVIASGRERGRQEFNQAAYARALKGMQDEGNIVTAPVTSAARRPGAPSQPYRQVTPETIDQPGTGIVPKEEVIGTAERIPGTAVGTPLREVPPNPQLGGNAGVGPKLAQAIAASNQQAKAAAAAGGPQVVGSSNIAGKPVQQIYSKLLKGTDVDTSDFPVGPEGIEKVHRILSDKYDEILPKLKFRIDNTLGSDFARIGRKVQKLSEKEYNTFQSEIADINRKMRNGSMSGKDFKIVQSELTDKANSLKQGSGYDIELGKRLDETLDAMRNSLERTNPLHGPRLRQLNENWANYSRIRYAGSQAGDQTAGFNPNQLDAAARALAGRGATGRAKTSENKALMRDLSQSGVSVLGSKVPNSGTPSRLLAQALMLAKGTIDPRAYAALAATPAYLPGGRQLTAAALARRPGWAKDLSGAFQQAAPTIGGAIQREEQ